MSDNFETEKYTTTRPKAISSKIDRSKTAPSEEFFQIQEGDSSEYYKSYNYYLYYYSQKHPNPRLPKPLYNKPLPDIDFIKGSNIEKKEEKVDDVGEVAEVNDSFTRKKEDLIKMMGNMNINVKVDLPHSNESPYNTYTTQPSIIYYYPKQNTLPISNPYNYYGSNQPHSQFEGEPFEQFIESNYNYISDSNQYQGESVYQGYKPTKKAEKFKHYNQGSNNNHYYSTQNKPYNNPMSNFQYNNNTYIFQQQIYPGKQQQNQPYMSNYYPQQDFNNYLRYNQYPQYEHNDNYGRFGGLDKQILDLSYADLNELLLHLIDLCKDHNGSRLVQKKYEEGSEEERSLIFDKLFPCIASLSKDQFGNYVIQKLFECSDNKKRKMMIAQLEGIVFELTLDTYGCRVVQKAIDVIEIEDVRKLLSEIKKDIKKCIEDQNGNHAIQKLVEKLPKGEHKEILKFVFGRAFELATHQYGCRVIQRVFEYCTDQEKDKILNEILARPLDIIQDQYGNYVIQHVLEKQAGLNVSRIYQFLSGKIYDFSIHKFASNVVEKCLCLGNDYQKKAIIDEILSRDDDSLLSMVKDKYGNYVVQKMIEFSNQRTKELIIKKICSSQQLKKRDGFSKHVINFIEKMGFPTPGSIAFNQQFGR